MIERNVLAELNDGRMSATQIIAVTICLLINMIDGFDVLVIAFTAPEIATDWNTSMQALGVLFSSGLAGMALGSLFIAPLADRFGRRPLILSCLALISISMLIASMTTSVEQLAVARVFTGLGIGGMLAALTTIVAEYSSNKRRAFAIAILMTGYPIGASLGGVAAVFITLEYGWRAVFVFGAILPALMIPLCLWMLPESIGFLLEKRPKNALTRINKLLSKMGLNPMKDLPERSQSAEANQASLDAIFGKSVIGSTLLLWAAFFLVMFSFYFVMSWTPKLLVSYGLKVEEGISSSIVINLGGVIGGLLLGYFTAFIPIKKMLAVFMIGSALTIAAFGLLLGDLIPLLIVGFAIGAFMNGSMIGLYTIGPELYPVKARSTGMGFAIGIGRVGAIISPLIAGLLLDSGWDVDKTFLLFAIPFVIAVITVSRIAIPKP